MENQQMKNYKLFLLGLPIIVIPMMLLAMPFLHGGQLLAEDPSSGINSSLPDVILEETPLNKWSTYDLDQLQKRKVKEEKRLDPYADFLQEELEVEDLHPTDLLETNRPLKAQEEQLQEKLQHIIALTSQEDLYQMPKFPRQATPSLAPSLGKVQSQVQSHNQQEMSAEIDRLEYLMQSMQQSLQEPDPELRQLEVLMDKVLALQYPDRYLPEVAAAPSREILPVFAAKQVKPENHLPDRDVEQEQNGFFGLSSEVIMEVPIPAAFPAVVAEDKQIVTGSSLMLQLSEDLEINGIQLQQGTQVHGICQLDGERLKIQIEHIRHENYLIPVKMEVYSLDALPGIAIPGAIGREASKEGMAQGIQGYNPIQAGLGLEAQLAATGVETARGFLGKKTKLKKVNVKHGHPILLVDKA
ncbi:conjugative transposon protein TraM [Belliella kenyensis]|uniref:Conjugative transposon protein TraM n=1 Tax=Belliella kenyensis TaxID=1472724 RepID=A0ABV8ELR0_9BACT|nr:conjugative transposon protein TraM [Belliella kenyensis]MDN3601854.1 conjugative transposon protein TraM [Belliella kenyensis]